MDKRCFQRIYIHHFPRIDLPVLYSPRGHLCGNALACRLLIPKPTGSSLPIQWGRVPCTDGHALDQETAPHLPKGREALASPPHAFMAVSQKQSPGNRMNRRVNKRRKPLAAYRSIPIPEPRSPSPRTGLTVPTPPPPLTAQCHLLGGYTTFAEKILRRGFTISSPPLPFLPPRGGAETARLSTIYQQIMQTSDCQIVQTSDCQIVV